MLGCRMAFDSPEAMAVFKDLLFSCISKEFFRNVNKLKFQYVGGAGPVCMFWLKENEKIEVWIYCRCYGSVYFPVMRNLHGKIFYKGFDYWYFGDDEKFSENNVRKELERFTAKVASGKIIQELL